MELKQIPKRYSSQTDHGTQITHAHPVFLAMLTSLFLLVVSDDIDADNFFPKVSNTPWGEMHCYVLNPKTKGVQVIAKDKSNDNVKKCTKEITRYR